MGWGELCGLLTSIGPFVPVRGGLAGKAEATLLQAQEQAQELQEHAPWYLYIRHINVFWGVNKHNNLFFSAERKSSKGCLIMTLCTCGYHHRQAQRAHEPARVFYVCEPQ